MLNTTPIDWSSLDAVVADLDGTLYLGNTPLPGALAFVQYCQTQKPLFFLSNNTSKTPDSTFEKLQKMSFPVRQEQVISPLHGLVQAILEQGIRHLWVLANAPVLAWLQKRLPDSNLRSERANTQCVVLTYDDDLHYQDLCEVGWRLQDGAQYWITHPDRVCPHPLGAVPDVGALVELFASGYQRQPERVFGKPNVDVLSPLFSRFNASRVLFIGDRLYTDWELAKRAGCQFRLVLSGETTPKEWQALEGDRPLILDISGQL